MDAPCVSVSSVGSLKFFRKENAPAGALAEAQAPRGRERSSALPEREEKLACMDSGGTKGEGLSADPEAAEEASDEDGEGGLTLEALETQERRFGETLASTLLAQLDGPSEALSARLRSTLEELSGALDALDGAMGALEEPELDGDALEGVLEELEAAAAALTPEAETLEETLEDLEQLLETLEELADIQERVPETADLRSALERAEQARSAALDALRKALDAEQDAR